MKPVIADRKPKKVTAEAGKEYCWCACGRSKNQPFCDGSHAGTDFSPKPFAPTASGDVYLCMCKRTQNPPYCDGTHLSLPEPAADIPIAQAPTSSVERHIEMIHELAEHGLANVGHHGEIGAMGVPDSELPRWNDIQIVTAQLARKPLLDDATVDTRLVLGPNAAKPLELAIPIFVSDMSFGALSEEAKIALAKGAELAGTGICSGEGGMLPDEQAENSHYLYELASAKFGFEESLLPRVQAFHFKGGQGAKTGTGGHLPGNKVKGKIAQVRQLPEGTPAISPSTFTDLHTSDDFKRFADRVREVTGGIPIGFKLSAQHIEEDIAFALRASADYIILDGRGGGTGAAPLIFRDNISVPTIPALARARRFLQERGRQDVTLIITGGLRTPADFVKAMALGADGIAVSNAAMQAIGCIAARICNTNLCPAGIATQDSTLRKKLDTTAAPQRLARFLEASVELMKVLARACGHDSLNKLNPTDLTTWKREMSDLSGVRFAGMRASEKPLGW